MQRTDASGTGGMDGRAAVVMKGMMSGGRGALGQEPNRVALKGGVGLGQLGSNWAREGMVIVQRTSRQV